MFAYCLSNPVSGKDPFGTRLCSAFDQDKGWRAPAAETDTGEDSNSVHVAVFYDSTWHYGFTPNMCAFAGPTATGAMRSYGFEVDSFPCATTADFRAAWTSCTNKEYNYDFVYIMFHGNANSLGWTEPIHYGEDLAALPVSVRVELYSCNGATRDENGYSIAQLFADNTGCVVRAATNKTFISPFGGHAFCALGDWVYTYPNV